MAPFMRKYEGETYALMRIVVGLLFFWHGTSKLFDGASGIRVGRFQALRV